ncbi:MAG: glycoside hydrolase family 5 protein [Planctomycetes bacterium]|nr:glycoside hydrolase family 5 protein [Planctomycetota bacterium]
MRSTILCGMAAFFLAASLACAADEEPPFRRGVNAAGPEFGGAIPGVPNKDYTFNNQKTFDYFAKKGLTVFRVPLKWERLQPALSGDFDAAYLAALKKNIEWAKAAGAKVILDIHNYCRYRVKIGDAWKGCIIEQKIDEQVPVKTADFQDLWKRLSKEFKDESSIYGYGLMNEPHDMGASDWKAISNAVIATIRENKDRTLILVGGLSWSNAADWEKHNGAESWVKDPENRFMYEAHCYFDADNSGSYKKSYADELAKNPDLPEIGRKRLQQFVEWCQKNKVQGFLGEFAAPRDDPRWCEVLENFLQELDKAGFGGTYWAGGIFWGEKYSMSLQPGDNFTTDRPQLAVLLKHMPAAPAAKP